MAGWLAGWMEGERKERNDGGEAGRKRKERGTDQRSDDSRMEKGQRVRGVRRKTEGKLRAGKEEMRREETQGHCPDFDVHSVHPESCLKSRLLAINFIY